MSSSIGVGNGSVSPSDSLKVALAFPGQGVAAQDIRGALSVDLDNTLVRRLLSEFAASGVDELDLELTHVCQPATYVAGIVASQLSSRPQATIGHSLGEIAAFVAAGSIEPGDGFALVVERGRISQQYGAPDGGMMAVSGLNEASVEIIRRQLSMTANGCLEIATLNGPLQLVLSGQKMMLDLAAEVLTEAGGTCQTLEIQGAFHSPLMLDARSEYMATLSEVKVREPLCPVVSPTDLGTHVGPDGVRAVLANSFVAPVRWHQACQRLAGFVDYARDMGPGRRLRRLARHGKVLEFR